MKTLFLSILPFLLLFSHVVGQEQRSASSNENLNWQQYSHLSIDDLAEMTASIQSTKGKKVPNIEESTQLMALAKAYEAYSKQYHNSSLAPEYLYLAADIYDTFLEDSRKALFVLGDLHETSKDHERHPDAVFKIAMIYSGRYNDVINARIWYDYFLLLYPRHSLASMARMGRDMLAEPSESDQKRYEKLIKQGPGQSRDSGAVGDASRRQ